METYINDLKEVQSNTAQFNPATASGAPAIVTNGVWTTTDTAVIGITPATDGNSCQFTAVAVGTFTVNVSAMNDAGAMLEALITGTVTASTTATGLNITFTTPV